MRLRKASFSYFLFAFEILNVTMVKSTDFTKKETTPFDTIEKTLTTLTEKINEIEIKVQETANKMQRQMTQEFTKNLDNLVEKLEANFFILEKDNSQKFEKNSSNFINLQNQISESGAKFCASAIKVIQETYSDTKKSIENLSQMSEKTIIQNLELKSEIEQLKIKGQIMDLETSLSKFDKLEQRISNNTVLEQKFQEVTNVQNQTETNLKQILKEIDNHTLGRISKLETEITVLHSNIGNQIKNFSNNLQSQIVQNGVSLLNLKCKTEGSKVIANWTYIPKENEWYVIQRRGINPNKTRISFEKNFHDYERGFGDYEGDFWIGLEKIYSLTYSGPKELKIVLTDWNETVKYAHYQNFEIGDKQDYYRLYVDGYSGDAGDSLTQHNGFQFSTYDKDNDEDSTSSCSGSYSRGGWWFSSCYYSYLNGQYSTREDHTNGKGGIDWNSIRLDYSFKASEMMIKIT